jgi:hypothetical protein
MKTLLVLLASIVFCGTAFAASPSSINNDDSCDIKVGPAATLLLPYFEVDVAGTSGQTTLFTITNVTCYPQIAHVTLWTDRALPVVTFNLFLTGYDVQAINLADVLIRGTVAPPNGTGQTATPDALSAAGSGNLRTPLDCAGTPGLLPASITKVLRAALTSGVFNPGGGDPSCNKAGDVHANAIGYATIDVVANCTNLMPTNPNYYKTDLLFDNVLIGDYQQIGANPAGTELRSLSDAGGNPMVHIRAMPEGGGAGTNVPTALPYTFYDRYTPAATRTIDRRQPLPSTFAARYIQGGPNGFATNMTIWREGSNRYGETCISYYYNSQGNYIGEFIRFDEHENPFAAAEGPRCECTQPQRTLAAASSTNTATNNYDSPYPALAGLDVGGWFYMNLNNGGSTTYSVTRDIGGVPTPTSAPTSFAPSGGTTYTGPRPSQNWVTVTLFGTIAGSSMTSELDAAPLGNGCSPAAFPVSYPTYSASYPPTYRPIGPAGGVFLCPPGTTLTDGTTALCTGTNVNPNP